MCIGEYRTSVPNQEGISIDFDIRRSFSFSVAPFRGFSKRAFSMYLGLTAPG
jgi:hypothetical protein